MVLLILGIIAVAAGAYLATHFADPFARFGGAVLVVLGLVLALFGVLDLIDAGHADVHDGVIHAFVSGRRWS